MMENEGTPLTPEAKQETATDVIIRAMEQADNMAEVIVIYRLRTCPPGTDGMGWNPCFIISSRQTDSQTFVFDILRGVE